MGIKLLSGDADNIDSLIVAAQMSDLWLPIQENVVVYKLHGYTCIYRMRGSSYDEIVAWNKLVELSFKFKLKRISRDSYEF